MKEKVFEFSTKGWEEAKAYKPNKDIKTKVCIGLTLGIIIAAVSAGGVATCAFVPCEELVSKIAFTLMSTGV